MAMVVITEEVCPPSFFDFMAVNDRKLGYEPSSKFSTRIDYPAAGNREAFRIFEGTQDDVLYTIVVVFAPPSDKLPLWLVGLIAQFENVLHDYREDKVNVIVRYAYGTFE